MPKVTRNLIGRRFFGLFIGAPGSGKTLAGASFAETGNIEFLDFDGRMAPVALYYPEYENINYDKFDVTNLEDFAYKFLPDLMKNCPYRTVHLAGITSLSVTAVTYQMYQKRGGDNLKKTKGGLMVPSWDEFSGESMIISQVLDALKSLPCNVIVEAHPVSRTSMTEGKFTSLVAFGPKVESLIPGYFDEIYYFKSSIDIDGQLVYSVRTRPNIDCPMAKTSLPLPSEFILSAEGKPIKPGLYSMIQEELRKYHLSLETPTEVKDESLNQTL